jgi:hypothetical protein
VVQREGERERELSKYRALSEPVGVKRILESIVACRDLLLGNRFLISSN